MVCTDMYKQINFFLKYNIGEENYFYIQLYVYYFVNIHIKIFYNNILLMIEFHQLL